MNSPDAPPKTVANVVIVLFLAIQVALPLSYYLGGDRYDERFAWRMFSPIRMSRCSATLFDASSGTEFALPLGRDVHVVWINLFKRARVSVLETFAEKWCGEGEGRVLRVDLTCVPPEAARHPICSRGGDRDRDGVPDGFAGHDACAGQDPKACYATLCGDASSTDCYAEHCIARIVPRDRDLCQPASKGGA